MLAKRYWDMKSSRSPSPRDRGDEMIGERYWGDGDKSKKRRRERSKESSNERKKSRTDKTSSVELQKSKAPPVKKDLMDPILTRTGGAYIPPAKLKMMQQNIQDKNSVAYQRLSWEALKKSINGLINKVNASNIGIIVRELLKENVLRARGILCKSIMQAQAFSQTFTNVYAALAAVINSRFPQIGELLIKRLIIQFIRGIKRKDKTLCVSSGRFLAHLVNQNVAHEIIALEILSFLFEKVQDITNDTEAGLKTRNNCAELAAVILTECGATLERKGKECTKMIFGSINNIISDGKIEERVRYSLEALWATRQSEYKDNPAVIEELDLVEEDQQITHMMELNSQHDEEDILNVFKHDPDFETNENKYKEIGSSILGGSDESGSDEGSTDSDDSEDEDDKDGEAENQGSIFDQTEGNMLAFRRTIYLVLKSSLDVDEAAHKIRKGNIKPGWEIELCNMILDCCAQERFFDKYFSRLAQRFCELEKVYKECFEEIFKTAYETCHRLETNKLRNVARLFSHLFVTDAISWVVMNVIRLTGDSTTSSGRVFIKILFQVCVNLFLVNTFD